MKVIDLRSDTVTLPSPKMRQAIFEAELGDDVFGEDPTTNRLEELAAERMGKEAGLLVASGTMGNLISILHPFTVANRPDGTMALDDMAAAIRPDDVHFPRTRLICLENTHNRCRGAVLTPEYIQSVADLAAEGALGVHMDGARIFNAAVALGVDVRELTRSVDSVTFCLSKGLAAPVGSVVCGTAEFIGAARRIRKALGGGMRQCGIIAAAGIVALEEMVERLAEDHANARRLAEGIARIEGLSVDLDSIATNMVYFSLSTDRLTCEQLLDRLKQRGLLCLALRPMGFRMVTHYGIEAADIDSALDIMADVMNGA